MRIGTVVLGSVLVVACTSGSSHVASDRPSPIAFPPGRAVELDIADGHVVKEVEVGPDPLVAAGTPGALWTLNLDDSTISRVDVVSGRVTTLDVGGAVGIGSDGVDVWVAADGNLLRRIDGRTGDIEQEIVLAERTLFGPRNAGFVTIGAGSVWVTVPPQGTGSHEVWRVDPSSGEVRSEIPIGGDPFPPTFVEGAVWIVDAAAEVVVRVDPRTERVVRRDLGPQPGVVAGGSGHVWVSLPGRVIEVDPRSARRIRSFPVPGAPRGMVWSGGRLWCSNDVGVVVVAPETGEVQREVELATPSDDEGPIALVPIDRAVWVTIEVA